MASLPRGHKRKISFADLEATFRRAGSMVAPAHPQQPPQLSQADQERQAAEVRRRLELARNLSQNPTDREVPDELAEVIVGDGVNRYKQLRDVERRLDAVMMRKRLDISDNMQRRYTRREGVLRVWISNTAEGQQWQVLEEGGAGLGEESTFDFGESSQATFRVKIAGKLLDDPLDEEDVGEHEDKMHRPKLSHFFKAITVDFDRNPALQPDGYNQIEWRKPAPVAQNVNANSSEGNFDSLEFERRADVNMNITINLTREERSERYKLSPLLAEIIDTEEEDLAGAVQGIWEYCRVMGLQEDEEKRNIVCDEPLRRLFNKETVYFPQLPDLLMPHLQPLPPVQLAYTIRVDKAYINGDDDATPPLPASAATIYDIRVPLPSPLVGQLTKFHTSKSHIGDLQTMVRTDDELALLVQKIHQTNAKRKFYDNLAKDPSNFIKRWTSSQQRDLEVVLAEATRGGGDDVAGEEFRRGGKDGLWGSQLARESVGLFLARGSKPM